MGFSTYDAAKIQGLDEETAYELAMEWGLTLAVHRDLANYLTKRKEVLLPNIITQARAEHKSPADVLHRFVLRLEDKIADGSVIL